MKFPEHLMIDGFGVDMPIKCDISKEDMERLEKEIAQPKYFKMTNVEHLREKLRVQIKEANRQQKINTKSIFIKI